LEDWETACWLILTLALLTNIYSFEGVERLGLRDLGWVRLYTVLEYLDTFVYCMKLGRWVSCSGSDEYERGRVGNVFKYQSGRACRFIYARDAFDWRRIV
jgi:hypothetical protein